MENLEEGIWVKTKDGYIDRLKSLESSLGDLQSWHLENLNTCYPNDEFENASENPIDLIKPGDIVEVDNIKHTVLQDAKTFSGKLYIQRMTDAGELRFTILDYLYSKGEIQKILTKEVFERVANNIK